MNLPAHQRSAQMGMLRRPRIRDEKHLAFIRTLPCIVSGDPTTTQAAHVRFGDPAYFKTNPGIGQKPSDCWTLPLSSRLHVGYPESQHEHAERDWWRSHGFPDPLKF